MKASHRRRPATLFLAILFCIATTASRVRAQAARGELAQLESRLVDADGTPKRLGSGDLDDLKTELGAYVAAHPEQVEGLYLRGVVHYLLRQYRSARADFEQSVRFNPRHALAHYNLGLTLEALSEWNAAREAYARSVTIDPSLVPAQFNLGRLYALSGQHKAAESAYYAAWLVDPGSVRVLLALGNSRLRAGDYRGALVYYERAAVRDPNSSLIDQNRALALEGLKRYEEALEAFRRLAQDSPNKTAPRLGWARCAFRLRMWSELDAALEPLLSLSSDVEETAEKLKKAAEKARAEENPLLARYGRLPTPTVLPSNLYGPEVPPRWGESSESKTVPPQ